jgi:hypothetical protein
VDHFSDPADAGAEAVGGHAQDSLSLLVGLTQVCGRPLELFAPGLELGHQLRRLGVRRSEHLVRSAESLRPESAPPHLRRQPIRFRELPVRLGSASTLARISRALRHFGVDEGQSPVRFVSPRGGSTLPIARSGSSWMCDRRRSRFD